jgi:hypothetical protein
MTGLAGQRLEQAEESRRQKEGRNKMASKTMEQQVDISDSLQASPTEDHIHPVNRRVHPGTAKASDMVPGGPDVPAQASRERVDPGAVNDQRRAPLLDVTPITSPSGNSHVVEPPPSRL